MRASDPTTPADELREVAKLHTPEVLRALGENPASPLDLLLHLAVWVPGRVLRNPALKLHMMSLGVQVLEGASRDALSALLDHPEGASLLPLAVEGSDASASAALSTRRLSPEQLGRLAERADDSMLRRLAREPLLPVPVLIGLARHREKSVREKAIENPSLPHESQRALLDEPCLLVWSLLHNPNLDPAIASRLLESPDPEIREGAASCPRLPVDELRRCARHADPALREAAAGNPSLPLPDLVLLTADRVAAVRAEAASQDRLSGRLLTLLAADPSDEVRKAVASSRATPPDALALLADDPEEGVRELVAANPQTPLDTLESLAQPPHPTRLALLENPRLPAPLARALVRRVLARQDTEEHELIALLTSPVLPAEDVAEVLRRNGLTGNLSLPPSTPEPLLRELAGGTHDTRLMVARHRAAPVELLQTLAWDRDPMITGFARHTLRRRGLALDE